MRATSGRVLSAIMVTMGWGAAARAAGEPPPGAVSAQTVRLPSAPGSVRGLAPDPEVSPFSGQAGYAVPLELPRTARGFAPAVALGYHGELGNGPLGIGWSVGVPVIRRSTHQGVPTYGATDELVLSGVGGGGRLVAISATEYRVEGAGNTVRVIVSGAGFKVWGPDGTRYDLGLAAAARHVSGTRVAAWYVQAMVDVAGQAVAYTYVKNQGQIYLDRVSWGPGGVFAAVFELVARPDVVTSWALGFSVKTARRVAAVRIESFGQVQRRYELTYDQGFALSRLEQVRCVGRGGADALPPVTFGYAARSVAAALPLAVGTWRLGATTVLVDVDGDGASDLVDLAAGGHAYRQNRGGSFGPAVALTGASNISLAVARLADVEGRARPNLIAQSGGFWQPYRIQGTSWVGLGAWQGTQNLPLWGANMAMADVNGDGRIDVVEWNAVGLQLRLGTADGVAAAVARPPVADVLLPDAATRWLDVNGDGLVDVVQEGAAALAVYLGHGDGTFEPGQSVAYPGGVPGPTDDLRFADLDRDGLLDAVRISLAQVRWYPGRANGTFTPTPVSLARPAGADSDSLVSVEDANGNGSEDVVWSSPAGMWALDLAGATSAGMLVSVDNGMGKTLAITYQATTVLAGADADAGSPWTWHLPIAIPVVVETTTVTGPGDVPRVVGHAVRNGFWDTSEHTFGGFLDAATITHGGADGDLVEETRFHSGSGVQRVLRGKPVQVTRSLVVAGVRTVVAQTVNTWRAMRLLSLPDVPLLRVAVLDQTRAEHPEGRPAGSPLVTRTTTTYDAEGRPAVETQDGRLDLTGDEKRTERTWASDATTWVRDRPTEEKILGGDGALVSWTRTYYGDDDELLALGQVGKGWVRRVDGWLAGDSRWVTRAATSYDPLGNPVHIEEKGLVRDLTYDDLGLFATDEAIALGAAGQLSWHAEYDPVLGVPVAITGPDGVEQRQSYDGLGRPIAVAIGAAPPHIEYVYAWESDRPRTETFRFDGPVGEVTARPATWTPASRWRHEIAVQNGASQPLYRLTRLATDSWLIADWREYDARGNVAFHGEPAAWSGSWSIAARPAVMVGQTLRFDPAGRVVDQTLPGGEHRTTAHAAFTSTTTTDGLASVTIDRDGQDRPFETRRESERARTRYDAAGRVVDHDLFAGAPAVVSATHSYRYDTLGRTVRVESSDHGARLMAYDDGDHMTRLDNAAGQWVTLAYEPAGRLTRRTLSDGSQFTYHYDLPRPGSTATYTGGRLSWVEEPTGAVELGYDALGNLADRSHEISGRTARRSAIYAASGQPLQVQLDDAVTLDLAYDAAGRLTAVGDVWQATTLDAAGRVLDERYGNGVQQTTGRDDLGQPVRIDVTGPGGAALFGLDVTRLPWGGIASLTDDDGRGLDHSASFAYDGRGRLTAATLGAGAAAYQLGFAYDDLQNMTSRTVSGPAALGSFSGTYHHGGGGHGPRQLTSIDGGPAHVFDYDAAGRQIQQDDLALGFNALDQLLSVDGLPGGGSVTHTYGFDGRRIATSGADGVRRVFGDGIVEVNDTREYDVVIGERVVARITVPVTDASGAAAVLRIDGDLARAILLAAAVALGLALLLAGRGSRRGFSTRATASAAIALALYGCAPGTGGGLGKAFGPGSHVTYFHAGVAPGPALFTDEAGQVIEERRYEPFGGPVDAWRPDGTGAVDFASLDLGALNRPVDPATGWSDHGARWMTPETGRWLSIDPPTMEARPELAERPWSLHPYQYTDQNPVLYWDPDGRDKAKVDAPSKLLELDENFTWFGNYYSLSKEASDILQPFFKTIFKVDISKVRMHFDYAYGNAAITLDQGVRIEWEKWHRMSDRDKLLLLTHEITHTLQYTEIGVATFILRYVVEYNDTTNYQVPDDLTNTPIENIDVVDNYYTLDQTAERVADEVGKMLNP